MPINRRSLLRSVIAAPPLARELGAQVKDKTAVREKGLPAGPPLVPPGINETPNTPVTPADQTSDSQITTFNAEQFAALRRLGELIVPAWDNKPGAADANAAEFLDFLIGCSPEARIALYKNGLDELNRRARQRAAKSFPELSASEAESLLDSLREPWRYERAAKNDLAAFLLAAKSDLLRATSNSRIYIDAVSQERRPRNASNFYWYPIS